MIRRAHRSYAPAWERSLDAPASIAMVAMPEHGDSYNLRLLVIGVLYRCRAVGDAW